MKSIKIVLLIVVLLASGCGYMIEHDEALHVATSSGYSNISIKDKCVFFTSWCGCSKEDSAAFQALAKNPKGVDVKIVICVGMLKGGTVRVSNWGW